MRVKINHFGEVESSHLPPIDQTLLLEVGANGRVRAIEKINAPTNHHGLPDPMKYINYLSMTLDSSYTPPKKKNTHHLVYPRSDYLQFGYDSVQFKYREIPSFMVDTQVQIHNYGHWVMHPPRMQRFEVMNQAVREQEQVDRLFKIARRVISGQRWLETMSQNGAQSFRTAEAHVRKHDPTEAMFLDALDAAEDGVFDIMPNRQALADMGLPAAARFLGVKAAARSLALDRETLTRVRELDIDTEPLRRAA